MNSNGVRFILIYLWLCGEQIKAGHRVRPTNVQGEVAEQQP